MLWTQEAKKKNRTILILSKTKNKQINILYMEWNRKKIIIICGIIWSLYVYVSSKRITFTNKFSFLLDNQRKRFCSGTHSALHSDSYVEGRKKQNLCAKIKKFISFYTYNDVPLTITFRLPSLLSIVTNSKHQKKKKKFYLSIYHQQP